MTNGTAAQSNDRSKREAATARGNGSSSRSSRPRERRDKPMITTEQSGRDDSK